jgi:GTPase SAR1 family protein
MKLANNKLAGKLAITEKELASDFKRLDQAYESVQTYIKNIANGELRSLIVNGPPGVGKSAMVEKFLKKYKTSNQKFVSGQMTSFALYQNLYQNKDKGQVLVLDDVDSIFGNTEGLNILKAAMDTTRQRRISWESNTMMLSELGLPKVFNFNGSVVLITNVGFGGAMTKQMAHLNALKDRSYCIPIADGGGNSAYKQIAYMIIRHDILAQYQLTDAVKAELLEYINTNLDNLYTVSLRTAIKLAEIYRLNPTGWRNDADVAFLRFRN